MTNNLIMRTKIQTILGTLSLVLLGSALTLHAQPQINAVNATTPAPVQQFDENQRNRQQQESLLNNLTTTNAPEPLSR